MQWKRRLANAIVRGHFTGEDIKLSGSWGTCVVGEASKLLTNEKHPDKWYGPNDGQLCILGEDFCESIKEQDIVAAVTQYFLIQSRLAELRKA